MKGARNRTIRDETLDTALAGLGISAPQAAVEKLRDYLALVAKWNRTYNLVGDAGDMVVRHVLDSAAALPFLRGTRMLDAGSGAGFPGMVLALLAPETSWVLVESNGKKSRFLEHAVRRLDLVGRVSVHRGRLESYHPPSGFDTVTARALANLATLAVWTAPLLAPGGRIVALKGRRAEIESECAALGPDWRPQVLPVDVAGLAAERHVVILEREKES